MKDKHQIDEKLTNNFWIFQEALHKVKTTEGKLPIFNEMYKEAYIFSQ